jgi:hypothetical protein
MKWTSAFAIPAVEVIQSYEAEFHFISVFVKANSLQFVFLRA